jgi:LDH2 family malate/lactate/ureidoglycolate dehydrogenase
LPVVDAFALRDVGLNVLAGAGTPADHAAIQVELLLEAELRGISSHGMLRLPRIVRRIANNVVDPAASGVHVWRKPGFLEVDGQRGFGPVVTLKAIEAIAERAHETGIAVAAIRNSNHIGMLAWYAEHLARQGLTAIVLSTSEALVHPWGGRQALIGTNPVAIGVPTGAEPLVVDVATSTVSMGKIHDYAHRHKPIPDDWALDEHGARTTDPEAAKAGAISPFGGAKGYALGLAFEVLVTSLARSAIGTDVRGTLDATDVCTKGDIVIAMEGSDSGLAAYLDMIRNSPPADGFDQVLIPGDRSRQCRAERLRDGVPVANEVWSELLEIAGSAQEKTVRGEQAWQ